MSDASYTFRLSGSHRVVSSSWNLGDQRVQAAELFGLTPGTVELQSAGPLSFGPSGVLFVGDAKAAKIYAINTEDEKSGSGSFEIENLNERLSAALGSDDVTVNDLAVNPGNGQRFLVGHRRRESCDCQGVTRWFDQPFES